MHSATEAKVDAFAQGLLKCRQKVCVSCPVHFVKEHSAMMARELAAWIVRHHRA